MPEEITEKPQRKLTYKQLAFIEHYTGDCNGNGVESARKAGYKGNINQLGQRAFELVNNSKVIAEIDKKKAEISAKIEKIVLNRLQRQQFWTTIINDNNADMADRLRASELLAKSEADFAKDNAGTDNNLNITVETQEKQELKLVKAG